MRFTFPGVKWDPFQGMEGHVLSWPLPTPRRTQQTFPPPETILLDRPGRNHPIDLSHESEGFFQRHDDLLIVGQFILGERSALAILQPQLVQKRIGLRQKICGIRTRKMLPMGVGTSGGKEPVGDRLGIHVGKIRHR